MIKSSLNFNFNNIDSSDFNIFNISVNSGLYEEPFVGSRSLLEQVIRYKPDPYYFQVKQLPKTFNLLFSLPDNINDRMNEIARWLNQPNYCPMYFSENPEKLYFVLLVNDSSVFHQGINGYLNLQFRTNSPYCFSPIKTTQLYDFTSNLIGGTEIIIRNMGDVDMNFIATVKVINGGTFSIINKSDNNRKIAMTGILNNETITLNTEIKDIQTDVLNTYRFGNLSSDSNFYEFSIPRGTNKLQIYGNLIIQFKYEFKFLI